MMKRSLCPRFAHARPQDRHWDAHQVRTCMAVYFRDSAVLSRSPRTLAFVPPHYASPRLTPRTLRPTQYCNHYGSNCDCISICCLCAIAEATISDYHWRANRHKPLAVLNTDTQSTISHILDPVHPSFICPESPASHPRSSLIINTRLLRAFLPRLRFVRPWGGGLNRLVEHPLGNRHRNRQRQVASRCERWCAALGEAAGRAMQHETEGDVTLLPGDGWEPFERRAPALNGGLKWGFLPFCLPLSLPPAHT